VAIIQMQKWKSGQFDALVSAVGVGAAGLVL
jgi:hypothetical protein